jgi:hypothetical protein
VKNINKKTKHFLDSFSAFDEFGFQIRPQFYWLPESINEEINRLAMNLAKYTQYLENGSRFPESVNQARLDDFNRLKELRRRAA